MSRSISGSFVSCEESPHAVASWSGSVPGVPGSFTAFLCGGVKKAAKLLGFPDSAQPQQEEDSKLRPPETETLENVFTSYAGILLVETFLVYM